MLKKKFGQQKKKKLVSKKKKKIGQQKKKKNWSAKKKKKLFSCPILEPFFQKKSLPVVSPCAVSFPVKIFSFKKNPEKNFFSNMFFVSNFRAIFSKIVATRIYFHFSLRFSKKN